MKLLTHIQFDFFGTLVAYSESRVEQGYPKSYKLLLDNGSAFTYQTFLNKWDELFDEFEHALHSSNGLKESALFVGDS